MTHSEQLVEQAQAAIKAGKKQEARILLQKALQQDDGNHTAWLLLALAAPSLSASETYIERAEQIAPTDPTVQKARAWLERQQAKQIPPVLPPVSAPSRSRKPFLWAGLAVIVLILLGATAVTLFTQFNNQDATAVAEIMPTAAGTTAVVPTHTPNPATPTPSPHPIQPKAITDTKNEPRATWTLTPTPTNTPTPSPTWQPTFQAPQEGAPAVRPLGIDIDEKWVDVNLTTQTLVAYEGNLPVFETLISSGLTDHETVTGQFRMWLRFEKQTMDGRRLGYDYYLEDVPYVMYFFEDYALHGTFWHNNFGRPMSHGCVNMYTPDAEWIFNWSELGTVVNVHY